MEQFPVTSKHSGQSLKEGRTALARKNAQMKTVHQTGDPLSYGENWSILKGIIYFFLLPSPPFPQQLGNSEEILPV